MRPLNLHNGTCTILVAVASNTASKLIIGAAVGRGWFAVEIALMSAACTIAAAVALWLALVFAPVG